MSINLAQLKRFDSLLFILMILLIVIGLTVLYSLSLATQTAGLNNFTKQFIFTLVALVIFSFICFIDFRFFRTTAYWIYILTIILLVVVLFAGETFRNVKGWLNFGFFNFQPSELAKLAVIMLLAKFWQEARQPVRLKDILISFILVFPSIYLIMRQPDLGSALAIMILWLGILFLVDRNKKHILGLLLIIILISTMAWLFFLEPYQKDRILTYIDPQGDPLGRGYQITQSMVAVGSGQITGRGFGLGPQSQLHFLPAPDTDFIFAVMAEEFGLIGSFLLLGLYTFFIYRLLKISLLVYDNFSLVFILGVAIYFFIQMVINIGMNIGLVPVIGLPLPFVSYGGSSLLISIITVAIVESIIIYQPFTKNKDMVSL